MRAAGDDLTDIFDPTIIDHFQLLNNGVLKLVKVDGEPLPTAVIKKAKR